MASVDTSDMDDMFRKFNRAAENSLEAVGTEIINEWRDIMRKSPRRSDGRSKVGNPPAPDTANLVNSLRKSRTGKTVTFYGARYGIYLNDSTDSRRRPWIEPGFRNVEPRIPRIVEAAIG